MSGKTRIEWTDVTWNPVTGCTKVSPGCDHCYAEGIATRFRGPAFPNGFDVTLRPNRLDDPFRWRKPSRVFVNSMSDLFHDDIPDHYIAKVFAVMALTPQHTYQVLTKRHGRMRSLLSDDDFRDYVSGEIVGMTVEDGRDDSHLTWPATTDDWWPLANVWLGVSVETQQWADIRIPALLRTPAAIRFLSCEPLLGELDLRPYLRAHIGWVIVGGESGSAARQMRADWARTIRDDCVVAGTPFFFKQWGAFDEVGRRVGKHKAGRVIDGMAWDDYPDPSVWEASS